MELGKLTDPKYKPPELDLKGFSSDLCISFLKKMYTIRFVEEKIAFARKEKIIGGPVHLGVGQEAIAVGVSSHLNSSDRVFGTHRSHSHILALGSSIKKLFAEVLGRVTGHSRGMGGSMHLWDQTVGFWGSVPIVAGTVPLAVGAGLALKMQKKNNLAVAYFGDGAIEEGVVHESLNLAKIHNIPILFVVENNLFSSHMHISTRQPKDSTARFAQANDVNFKVVDGNNIIDIYQASKTLINDSKNGKGPGFLEAVTYRWYGHVDWRDDVDVGVNRSKEDIIYWKSKDPIKRLKDAMINQKIWSQLKNKELCESIEFEIDKAWDQALNDPYPPKSQLSSTVYAQN